jgi:AcrR family transcriptional regulator
MSRAKHAAAHPTSTAPHDGADAKHPSQSVPQSDDARVARTRARLSGAFFELLRRRRYDRIHVTDLLRVGRTSRATFYRHYASKDALLEEQFMRVLRMLVRARTTAPVLQDYTRFFAHVQQSPFVWTSLMGGPARSRVEPVLRRCLERHARDTLPPATDAQAALRARFLVSTLLTVLTWSIEEAPRASPQRLQALYAALAAGGAEPLQ